MSIPGTPITKFQAISAVATTVNLKRICRQMMISLDPGSSDIYLTFDGTTPTVGGAGTFKIAGGTTWTSPANVNLGIDSFKFIGSGSVGNMSILAG
jgi:hypothetical protein